MVEVIARANARLSGAPVQPWGAEVVSRCGFDPLAVLAISGFGTAVVAMALTNRSTTSSSCKHEGDLAV